MIEFRNVSLVLQKKEILKDVSFSIESGKITSVIGKNGAGKTSALKCLIGENAYTGQILLNGCDIRKMTVNDRAKRISYLPQMLRDVSFTVDELASLGRRPHQTRIAKENKEDREMIERALILTDMHAFRSRRVDTLSGGEKQRAYLAMVLSQDADVIVLDEPSAYMDAPAQRELTSLLKKLSKEMGKTIVRVLHDLSCTVNDSDNIVIMDRGRVMLETDAESVKNGDLIEKIFSVKKGMFLSDDGEKKTIYI